MEVNQNEAGITAPESTSTASVETVENPTPEEQEPRVFTQEELDRIVAKEKDKAERKVRRELAQQAQEAPRQPSAEAPKPDQFQSAEAYIEAVADWKADQKIAERENQKQQVQAESTFAEREEAARDKYSDFEDVVYRDPKDGGPAISQYMAQVIKESELGPDIAYHLGKNPKEAARIYELSPLAQARELGKIEATLTSTTPPVKKTSSAPEPIKPVNARTTTAKYDTSDPRSATTMSTSEWIKARNAEIANKPR